MFVLWRSVLAAVKHNGVFGFLSKWICGSLMSCVFLDSEQLRAHRRKR